MSSFVYYNMNPYKVREEDCVTRAISAALNLDYNVVRNLLRLSAQINNCEELCVSCYHLLLEDIFDLPVMYCNHWETVEDIADMYPNNKVIIRMDGHLTASLYGRVFDLFDCQGRLVDCYWIVEN